MHALYFCSVHVSKLVTTDLLSKLSSYFSNFSSNIFHRAQADTFQIEAISKQQKTTAAQVRLVLCHFDACFSFIQYFQHLFLTV